MAAEIGEINRFTRPKRLVSYARLAPRVHHSGDGRARSGPLSKSRSRLLGWAAVEAAQQAWRESNPWHQLYLDVARRSRHTNAAKATVARKILIAAWHTCSPATSPSSPPREPPTGTAVPASSRSALAARRPLIELRSRDSSHRHGVRPTPTRRATNANKETSVQPSRSNKEELRSTSRDLDERPFFRKSPAVATGGKWYDRENARTSPSRSHGLRLVAEGSPW